MLTESTSINGSSSATVNYSYNELGQLTGKTYGNGATESMAYNIQGWLSSKNAVKSGTNLFSMNLLYYNSTRATNKYTGNIVEWQWTQGAASQNSYALSYDKLSRLTNSNRYEGGAATNAFTEKNLTYDKNGNITQLQRYGSTGTLQDNFTYSYNGAIHNGNRLSSISGSVSATYDYDNNGNMTTDGRKNLAITYNVLNLQQTLSQSGTAVANYSWLADGTKFAVVDNTTNGYDYSGSLIYTRNGSTRTLESTDFGGGRIVYSGSTYSLYYYITDHLGSIRTIVDNSGDIQERNDYYPFGGKHANGSSILPANHFKFNGKELQTTGFLDYGARMYDDVIGRWGVVDPMALKYSPISTYTYCVNNPIKFIDPDGKKIINPNKYVLSNKSFINEMKKFDLAIARLSGKDVDSYTITVTGGDRYKKSDKVFSKTNNSEIKNSASKSKHLQSEGAIAVDLATQEISYDILAQAAEASGFRIDPSGSYTDGHFHIDLKDSKYKNEYLENNNIDKNYIPSNDDFQHGNDNAANRAGTKKDDNRGQPNNAAERFMARVNNPWAILNSWLQQNPNIKVIIE